MYLAEALKKVVRPIAGNSKAMQCICSKTMIRSAECEASSLTITINDQERHIKVSETFLSLHT